MFGYTYIQCNDEKAEELRQIQRVTNKILTVIHKLASCYRWDLGESKMPSTVFETMTCIHGLTGTLDGLSFGWVVPSKEFDKETGLPKAYNITYADGTQVTDVPREKIALCYNGYRALKSDIYLAEISGEMLANIDLSEVCNIIYSRNLPVPIVDDDIDKTQIEQVVKNSIRGRLSVVSKKFLSKFKQTGTDSKPVEMLPIFNVNSSENLQDLSRFCEEIEKRLLLERGIEIGSIDKKAQVSEDEINNMSEYAFLSVYDLTNCREEFCKEVKEKFGKDISVKHIKDIMKEKQKKEEPNEESNNDEVIEEPSEDVEKEGENENE